MNRDLARQALQRCEAVIGPFYSDYELEDVKSDIATALPEEWDIICENTDTVRERTEMIRAFLATKPRS